jgi:hypothetical protein
LVVDTEAPLQLNDGPFAVALPEIAEGIQGWRQQQSSSSRGGLRSAAATDQRQSAEKLRSQMCYSKRVTVA